jgi:hypothetical protein
MSYLSYLSLFTYSGVQHILCCVFLCIVNLILPVSLDCSFLIAPSVFPNVYLNLCLLSKSFGPKIPYLWSVKNIISFFLIFCKSCLSLLGNLM